MPPFSTRSATARSAPACADAARRSPCATKSGIGTPQLRWREMRPVGAVSIMPPMRALAPVGIQTRSRSRGARSRAARLARQPRLVHADEPLRRRAEDDRRLVAPAVRVAVANAVPGEQRAVLRSSAMMPGSRPRSTARRRAARAGTTAVVATGIVDRRQAVLAPTSKSSWPWPGACARGRCRPRASRARREDDRRCGRRTGGAAPMPSRRRAFAVASTSP